MAIDGKRARRPIEKFLRAAGLDLDLDLARRALVEPPNILAANHLQQAAEKILAAVRVHRGLLNTKDHDIEILIEGRNGGEPRPLPDGDVWRARFDDSLRELSAYATAFRYNLTPEPKVEDLRVALGKLTTLHELARKELLP